MARYLGIDHGEKRIGLAISDPTATIAQSFRTILFTSSKDLVKSLKQIIIENEVEKIVIGLPLTMKGTDSKKTQEVRNFAEKLSNQIDVPIKLIDERLSSVQAHLTMRQLGKKPSRNKERVDQLAAQSILQTYLDREKKGEINGAG